MISQPVLPQRTRVAALLMLTLLLASCAAAPPELKPAEKRGGPMSFAKSFESGKVEAGVYTPSEAERALDCKRLRGSMTIIIARLKEAPSRPRPGAVASAIQSGVSSVKGQTNQLDLDAELLRERARLTAYNALLAEKKCPTMDLAKELPPAG